MVSFGGILGGASSYLGGGYGKSGLSGSGGTSWDTFASKTIDRDRRAASDAARAVQPRSSGGGLGGSAMLGRDLAAIQQAGEAAWKLHHPTAAPLSSGGTPTPAGATPTTAATASGGSYGSHEGYRQFITEAATSQQIDPDALAAFLQIEVPWGDPKAVSPAGARGLGQIMPATWQGMVDQGLLPADADPFDPYWSIMGAAIYFGQQYKTYGSYDLAAAAYLGGGGGVVNGKPNPNNFDGNMSSAEYAALWARNYQAIKAAAPKVPAGGSGLASMFGGQNFTVSQEFGRTDYSTGPGAGVYDFGTEFGLDGDSHSGWDIGTPHGTQFYMPAGLGGKVTIAGGSGFYRDTTGGDGPGRGELRIELDNGMILILGHNSRINVAVGQRVDAGTLLGLTGTSEGPHLHVEVRRRDPSTPSGWRIVDPAELFGRPTPQPGPMGG